MLNHAILRALTVPEQTGEGPCAAYWVDYNSNWSVSGQTATKNAAAWDVAVSGLALGASSKVYFEIQIVDWQSTIMAGVAADGTTSFSVIHGVHFRSGGEIDLDSCDCGTSNAADSHSLGNGSVLGFAVDTATGDLWIAEDGTWYDSGDPANGTNPLCSGKVAGTDRPAIAAYYISTSVKLHVQSSELTYTPPAGFAALGCS